ncbi:MAG: hypothetical protein Q4A09_07245 [Capnocytophaga felis]|nr:hypothetical protein [Capnocytophaga felis]
MIKQYPHFLFVITEEEAHQDDEGNWIGSSESVDFYAVCREETDSRGQEVQTAGGVFRQFSSAIFLPKGTKKIDEGKTVFVANDLSGSDIRIKGQVLKFDVGQLHSRLWL